MDQPADNQSTSVDIARFLIEFLEVAITSVVFLKGVYPSGAFERRRYLNLVVHRARHPLLKEYIHSTVTGLLPHIQKGLVERVAVIFFSPDNNPFERFVFKFSLSQSSNYKTTESELELSVRSFLVKLPLSESFTTPLPQGCRWEIVGYFRALPDTNSSEQVLWISSNGKQWQHLPLITPIKSVISDVASLQLYLEQSTTFQARP